MRILQLDAGREMRGGQWQVLRLLRGLAQSGLEGTLLARAESPLYCKAAKEGLPVEPLRWIRLSRLSRRVDLVHAHDARSHTWAALFARAPVIVSRRVAFPVRSTWKYNRATRYLAVSEHVKQILVGSGVPEDRISVVYDGVPLRVGAVLGTGVVAPATADPQKGFDLVQDAARISGIPVKFSGDLDADLPGAGLFVYMTRSEGLGSGVLLAMAAGVPVLASRVGGLPEIIVHGENGWLVENDPAAIAAAMRTLIADRSLAESLAARARQTVEDRFSVEGMVHATIQVYRRVLSC
jgi:hypothetical protein